METLYAIAISFFLSIMVGMERQLSKKPVGFAPYVLVAVLSTVLTSVALSLFSDSAPVISGIITGIGFLGAGALVKYREHVFGFTTASIVWAMAAFGVMVSIADINTIIFTYVIIWAILLIDRVLEMRGFSRHTRTVIIEAKGLGSHADIKDIIGKYKDSKEEGLEMNFDRGIVEYRFLIPAFAKLDSMIKELSGLKDMRKIQIE